MRLKTQASVCVCGFATVFLALVLAAIAPTSALCQTSATGALTGTVKDSSGAVLPNATISATSADTGQVRTSTSRADGSYQFALLNPGMYRLKFEAAGFSTAQVPSVTVTVTETAILDQTLQVGAQTQQVEVRGEAETVQTSTATQGTVLSNQTIMDLPLNVRNYTALLGLSAGANTSVGNAGALGRGTQEIAVNGAAVTQNNYSMDGVSVVNASGSGTTADAGGSTGMGVVNPDAIQEFKIQTSLFDAGYGRNPGASVNVVTKSGTNQFHGAAFEFFRNTALNANDYFRKLNPAPNNTRQVLNQNQFGGAVGGPVKKDKLFFFAAYQETQQKNGVTIFGASNPTLVGIPLGDRTNTAAFQAALGSVFCPAGTSGGSTRLGGTQVACNGANINPVAVKLLQLKNPDGSYFIPSSTTGKNQNVSYSSPALYKEHQAVGNMDYLINGKNTLAARWFFSQIPEKVQFGCGVTGVVGTSILPCLPDDPGTIAYKNQYGALRLTTILSNTLVNEARISFQQSNADLTNDTPFRNSQVGMASLYPGYVYTPGNDLLAFINISGLFQFGSNLSLSNVKHAGAWEVADQISWSHGRHTFRTGAEYERDRTNWNLAGVNLGNLTFQTFQDFLLGLPGCAPGTGTPATLTTPATGACLASQQAGLTNGTASSNISSSGSTPGATYPGGLIHHFRNPAAEIFVQDDFKVSKSLTLNLGLRWEYDSTMYDKDGQAVDVWPSQILTVPVPPAGGTLAGFVEPANYNPALNAAPQVSGVIQSSQKVATQNGTPRDNFAPRVGLAWKPFSSDRFVVRGGAGYFYDRVGQLRYATGLVQSIPYVVSLGRSGTSNFFSSLQQPYPNTAPQWTPRTVTITPATNTGTSSNLAALFLDPQFTTPTTYEWNLDTQYEFAPRWMVEVAYVGSRSIHQLFTGQPGNRQYNEALLVSASNPYNGITQNTAGNASVRVPYLGFSPNGLTGTSSAGDTKFHSLQLTVRKQFSRGFQMQAAYTYSRDVTTTDYFAVNDPNILKYGLAAAYRPQRLTINYGWDLPFGTHEGFLGKLTSGWNLAGVTVVQDGLPLTVLDTRGGVIYGFGPGTPVSSTAQFAAGMSNANVATSGSVQQRLGGTTGGPGYFNKAAFSTVPVIGATPGIASTGGTGYGNAGLGVILGPGQFNFDATLQKTTRVGGIHEDASLVFRAEFFNVFNHSQFNAPTGGPGPSGSQTDVSNSSFGQITSMSVNPRLLQFALKYQF
jgi:Carboxypeptidase regulatory-like domain